MKIKTVVILAIIAIFIIIAIGVSVFLIQTRPWVEEDFSGTVTDMDYNEKGEMIISVDTENETLELTINAGTECLDYDTGDSLNADSILLGGEVSGKYKGAKNKELMWIEVHKSEGSRDIF